MKPILTQDILFNYFSGSATALQKTLIREWLEEDAHVELYYEWLAEWERAQPQFLPDATAAFQKSLNRINGNEVTEMQESADNELITGSGYFFKHWIKIAACLLLIGLGAYSQREFLFYEKYQTAYGELKSLTLEDGSEVFMNANSRLLVPRFKFWSNQRNVFLKGEAEFVVKHTADDKQFIVHAQDENRIVVLGTTFVVYTRPKGTRVVLNTGKVQFEVASAKKLLSMKPGDKASINERGYLSLVKLSPSELANQSAWKQKRFVFANTSLKEVAINMQEVFGVNIQIGDSALAGRELTGSFKAQTAEELFSVLSEMLEIGITKVDDNIIFTPESLPEL